MIRNIPGIGTESVSACVRRSYNEREPETVLPNEMTSGDTN